MLRSNSRLHLDLGTAGVAFLEHAAASIERILPHVSVSSWTEGNWAEPGGFWTGTDRKALNVRIACGKKADGRTLSATVRRRRVAVGTNTGRQTLDVREHDICNRIARRSSAVIGTAASNESALSLTAIREAFDEQIVAEHLKHHHNVELHFDEVLKAFHQLSEQTYENKALTFGCIVDPSRHRVSGGAVFPADLLSSKNKKKYKALSDGFRTAYHVSSDGALVDFVDLRAFTRFGVLSSVHMFPEWAEDLAAASRDGRCGLCLSRQGDILVFEEGSLRFTYRYGRWQYWNHAHLVTLLRDRARTRHVVPASLGKVVASIYRAAIDVSFRRSGGLFVILRNRKSGPSVLRKGDAIGSPARGHVDVQFDAILEKHTIQTLPRAVAAEIAALDGAVVLDNSGRVLAFGAVLEPKKHGKLQGTEGSRTKAAIGASKYGVAVKVSSDGEITVYHNGTEFIRI